MHFLSRKFEEFKLKKKFKKGDSFDKNEALKELAQLRTNGATRFIIKCLEGDLFSDDAAEILGKLKTKKAVIPLVKALNENESDVTRWEAAEALGEIGDKRAVDSLIKVLNNSKNDTMIREKAAVALGKIGGEKASAALIKRFPNEKDKGVKGQIINGIGESHDPSKFEFLVKLLKNNDFQFYAARALGLIGDKRAVESLIKLLKNPKTDIEVLERVTDSLGQLKDERAVTPLINFIQAKEYSSSSSSLIRARTNAIRALGNIGSKKAVMPLIDFLKAGLSYECIEALGKIGDKSATELIMKWWDEKNDDIMRKIIIVEALGKLRDKKAKELLKRASFLADVYERQIPRVGGCRELKDAALLALKSLE